MPRDLTKRQFEAWLSRHGIVADLCGYYRVANNVLVYARNAGDRRRDQLAYLVRQQQRALASEGPVGPALT